MIGIPGGYTALVVMYKLGLHKPLKGSVTLTQSVQLKCPQWVFWFLEVKPTLSSRSLLGSVALVSNLATVVPQASYPACVYMVNCVSNFELKYYHVR